MLLNFISILIFGLFLGTFIGFYMYAKQSKKYKQFDHSTWYEWWLIVRFVFMNIEEESIGN